MKPADFRTLLLAQPGLSAVVGARIFPVKARPETWDSDSQRPCLIYRVDGVGRSSTFCATSGLVAESVAVDCYARSYDGAVDLALLVKQVIDFSGQVGETLFNAIRLESEFDLMDLEPGLFRRALSFTIWNRSV